MSNQISSTGNAKLLRSVDVAVNPDRALFQGRDVKGFEVPVDMANKMGIPGGDLGFAARDLLLIALAGCAGTSFLAGMRDAGQKISSLSMRVDGTLDTKPPQVFRHIRMLFRLSGPALDPEKVGAALAACHGTCSIAATLSHVAQIDSEFEIIPEPAAIAAPAA